MTNGERIANAIWQATVSNASLDDCLKDWGVNRRDFEKFMNAGKEGIDKGVQNNEIHT